MNIELMKQATERDHTIGQTLMRQIHPMTLLANGFKQWGSIPNGAELEFRLSRPYGHRSIFITLNGNDYYDMKVVKFGKNFTPKTVREYNDVDFTQLNELIHEGIARSCD